MRAILRPVVLRSTHQSRQLRRDARSGTRSLRAGRRSPMFAGGRGAKLAGYRSWAAQSWRIWWSCFGAELGRAKLHRNAGAECRGREYRERHEVGAKLEAGAGAKLAGGAGVTRSWRIARSCS